jgi:hypothetical protein
MSMRHGCRSPEQHPGREAAECGDRGYPARRALQAQVRRMVGDEIRRARQQLRGQWLQLRNLESKVAPTC